jgi:hypothetical protein
MKAPSWLHIYHHLELIEAVNLTVDDFPLDWISIA